jgi:hypothetical protein
MPLTYQPEYKRPLSDSPTILAGHLNLGHGPRAYPKKLTLSHPRGTFG